MRTNDTDQGEVGERGEMNMFINWLRQVGRESYNKMFN